MTYVQVLQNARSDQSGDVFTSTGQISLQRCQYEVQFYPSYWSTHYDQVRAVHS